MNNSYQDFHKALILQLTTTIRATPPFNDEATLDEAQQAFNDRLKLINSDTAESEERSEAGQWLITNIVSRYPHLTPNVPRDLFWYFGGDCLHFLGDEEIDAFQRLDENYHQALTQDSETDYLELRKTIIGDDPLQPTNSQPIH